MDKPIGNLVFGYEVPNEVIESIAKTGNFYESGFLMTNIIELCKNHYPFIETLNEPTLTLKMVNKEKSTLGVMTNKLNISEIIYNNDIKFSDVWEKVYEISSFVSRTLKIESVRQFGINLIQIIEKDNIRKKYDDELYNLFESNKLIDKETQNFSHSNVFRFNKHGKIHAIKVEPLIEDKNKTYIECNTVFKQEMPVKNIKELIRQEINYYNKVLNFLLEEK